MVRRVAHRTGELVNWQSMHYPGVGGAAVCPTFVSITRIRPRARATARRLNDVCVVCPRQSAGWRRDVRVRVRDWGRRYRRSGYRWRQRLGERLRRRRVGQRRWRVGVDRRTHRRRRMHRPGLPLCDGHDRFSNLHGVSPAAAGAGRTNHRRGRRRVPVHQALRTGASRPGRRSALARSASRPSPPGSGRSRSGRARRR